MRLVLRLFILVVCGLAAGLLLGMGAAHASTLDDAPPSLVDATVCGVGVAALDGSAVGSCGSGTVADDASLVDLDVCGVGVGVLGGDGTGDCGDPAPAGPAA